MNKGSVQRVGVVGGGLGGLAAACTLAARGYQVTLFEKNRWLGGKAAQLEIDGYRFDMGPTILTLPSVLDRIFQDTGVRRTDYIDLVRLDPQWRCFFDNRRVLDLTENVQAMAERCDQIQPRLGQGYRDFMRYAERMHRISDAFFFWRSIDRFSEIAFRLPRQSPGLIRDAIGMRLGHSVAGTVRRFLPHADVAQMVDHFTQYVGSAPDRSPAVLCGIAHMQTTEGIHYPRGGIRAVPDALIRRAEELGVELRPGTGVSRIRTDAKGRVNGLITTDGQAHDFDAVVSNMDSVRTYRELLGGEVAREFVRRRHCEPACSGVVLYLGLDRRYEQLCHHNFVFSRDPEEEFDWIYRRGEPAPDPTCYVCAPAVTDPNVAPPGGEALYILVHTPYLRPHHDWTEMLPRYRRVILDKLARTAGLAEIEKHIRVERALTPQDIHDRYWPQNGAIYGLASHGKFWGAFKPGNRRAEVPGLYLCGGAAHPGPGMPMVLMSGWIAADSLDQDARAFGKKRPVAAAV